MQETGEEFCKKVEKSEKFGGNGENGYMEKVEK